MSDTTGRPTKVAHKPLCFGLAWYATEEIADAAARIIHERGDVVNGGWLDGMRCGRASAYDVNGQFAVMTRGAAPTVVLDATEAEPARSDKPATLNRFKVTEERGFVWGTTDAWTAQEAADHWLADGGELGAMIAVVDVDTGAESRFVGCDGVMMAIGD